MASASLQLTSFVQYFIKDTANYNFICFKKAMHYISFTLHTFNFHNISLFFLFYRDLKLENILLDETKENIKIVGESKEFHPPIWSTFYVIKGMLHSSTHYPRVIGLGFAWNVIWVSIQLSIFKFKLEVWVNITLRSPQIWTQIQISPQL